MLHREISGKKVQKAREIFVQYLVYRPVCKTVMGEFLSLNKLKPGYRIRDGW